MKFIVLSMHLAVLCDCHIACMDIAITMIWYVVHQVTQATWIFLPLYSSSILCGLDSQMNSKIYFHLKRGQSSNMKCSRNFLGECCADLRVNESPLRSSHVIFHFSPGEKILSLSLVQECTFYHTFSKYNISVLLIILCHIQTFRKKQNLGH